MFKKFGQLGIPEITYSSNWNNILNNVNDISCGEFHTIAKSTDNSIFSFGLNIFGQLGLKDFNNRFIPNQISDFGNIKQISTGDTFSIFLKHDNKLYSCGSNKYGQLGLGIATDVNIKIPEEIKKFTDFPIKKISFGFYHTLVLDNNGDIYSFGLNEVNYLFNYSLVN
jgi:alpha-tubulin suppressor-like RCC1 family protein